MNDAALLELLSELKLDKNILLEDIPDLDLYMDQVIQLFENKFGDTLRNDKDKVLTKTMINNYSKDKLFMQGKNKKYSKSHLILLSLIYQLKGSLTITDTKNALSPIVKTIESGNTYPLNELYSIYLKLFDHNADIFNKDILERLDDINKLEGDQKGVLIGEYENILMLLFSFVTMSNFYRKAAEKLLDEVISKPGK